MYGYEKSLKYDDGTDRERFHKFTNITFDEKNRKLRADINYPKPWRRTVKQTNDFEFDESYSSFISVKIQYYDKDGKEDWA